MKKSILLILVLAMTKAGQVNAQAFIWAKQTSTLTPTYASVVGTGTSYYSGNYSCGFFTGSNIKFGNCSCTGLTSTGSMPLARSDAFFVKHDDNGNTIWQTSAGGSETEVANYCVATPSGMYVAGTFDGPSISFPGVSGTITLTNNTSGTRDIFVGKIRLSDGKFNWAVVPTSSSGHDQIRSFAVRNSYVYIEGEDNFTAPYIKRINATTGATTWTLSGAIGGRIGTDYNGNLYSFCYANGSPINQGNGVPYSLFNSNSWNLVKFNSSGMVTSYHAICHSAAFYTYGFGFDGAGNVYVAGYDSYALGLTVSINFGSCGSPVAVPNPGTGVPLYLAKFNSSLIVQWAKALVSNQTYGDGAFFTDIETDNAGNSYISGNLYADNTGFPSMGCTTFQQNKNTDFVVKVNSAGSVIWSKTDDPTAGSVSTFYGGVAIDINDYCYFTGYYNLTDHFDAITLTNSYPPDFFVAKLSSLANTGYSYFCSAGAPTVQIGTPAAPGTSYSWTGPGIVGSSTVAMPTVNASGTYTVTATMTGGCSETDVTIVCICTTINCIQPRLADGDNTESDPGDRFSMVPNPANNKLTISFSRQEIYEINLYNSAGILVVSQKLSALHSEFDLSTFLPGLYFVIVRGVQSEFHASEKLVVIK